MNYGQVVEQIRDLGFADDSEMEEFGTIVPNSINRAITELSISFAPNLSYKEVTQPTGQTWNEDAYYEYAMPDDFMKFADTPVKRALADGVYERFNDFEVEGGDTIIMKGSYTGTFRFFYVADHEPFTEDTEDTEDIPLPLKVHYLVPLLASYYVWMDDDPTKANTYYSSYQAEMQTIVNDEEKPRGKILADWGL